MAQLTWLGCVVGLSLGMWTAGCGGNDGPDTAAGTGGATSDGGGLGTGGLTTGGNSDVRYGDAYGSLTEICDVLSWGQIRKSTECRGLTDYYSAPEPFYRCPDALFSEGSTRPTTIDGAWDCVKQWEEISCDDLRAGLLPACVSPGTHSTGEPCVTGAQCESGSCSALYTDTCGECIAVGDGTSCDESTACPGMLYCDGGTCLHGLDPIDTETPIPIGESCSRGGCAEGAICAYDAGADMEICQIEPADGQPCLSMYDPRLGDSYTCSGDYVSRYCDANLLCQSAAPIGSPCPRSDREPLCDAIDGCIYCADGGGCNAAGICQLPPAAGQACLEPSVFGLACAEGHVCQDEICKVLLSYGEDCSDTTTTECNDNSECIDGRCAPIDELTTYAALCGP